MTIEQLIKDWNKQRKANKNKWLYFNHDFNGKTVRIKSYNLWIQRIEYCDFIDGCNVENVKGVNEFLLNFLDN